MEEILRSETWFNVTPPPRIIDVEDLSYADLIKKITFETTAEGFKNFTETESGFLSALKAGQRIILKGEFSADLLAELEPLLAGKEPFVTAGQNLTLIIEDKNCRTGQQSCERLRWLPQDSYEIRAHEKTAAPEVKNLFTETESLLSDLTNSATTSAEFVAARKNAMTNALQANPMVALVGESGVGKSGLIKMFERDEKESVAVYRELNALESWANDDSAKTKILFIDESNIEDSHFTMFSPLKPDGDKNIFYQGKFYPLDQNHKVVFAHNSIEYGGGRVAQKLFADGTVPVICLVDFPSSYIYEEILKKSIYEKLGVAIKTQKTEEQFKQICQPLIKEYQSQGNHDTVRELQEKVLLKLVEQEEVQSLQTGNFTSTADTKTVEEVLGRALSVRQKQRSGEFPSEAVGLNGVLIEGDSGTGKSELIKAMLASQSITEQKLGSEESAVATTSSTQQHFYKIEASMRLKEKREIIRRAFFEGNIVWIDELNSCIDEGLEKILNAALTGDARSFVGNGEELTTPVPGFMLISSVNSVVLEGRSTISPALRHRSNVVAAKSLREYSQESLATIVESWIDGDEESKKIANDVDSADAKEVRKNIASNVAKDFKECLGCVEGANLNLRTLRSKLPEILPTHKEAVLARKALESLSATPAQTIPSTAPLLDHLAEVKKETADKKSTTPPPSPHQSPATTHTPPPAPPVKKTATPTNKTDKQEVDELKEKFQETLKIESEEKFTERMSKSYRIKAELAEKTKFDLQKAVEQKDKVAANKFYRALKRFNDGKFENLTVVDFNILADWHNLNKAGTAADVGKINFLDGAFQKNGKKDYKKIKEHVEAESEKIATLLKEKHPLEEVATTPETPSASPSSNPKPIEFQKFKEFVKGQTNSEARG